MITSTTLFFSISGTEIPECMSLKLEQGIHGHHTFHAVFSGAGLEKDLLGLGEDSMKKIGMPVKIEFTNTVGHDMVFNGIITSVNVQGSHQSGQGQQIIFEGYSPTILLENGPSCQAFTDLPLSQIITKASNCADKNMLKLVTAPINDIKQSYTVQYNETAFTFINRITRRYGEWCYYDGVNLVIGNKQQPTYTLNYGSDLYSFSLSMQSPAVHRQYVAHSYTKDESITINTKDKKPSLNGKTADIYELASKTWQSPEPAIAVNFDDSIALKKQMDDMGKVSSEGIASQTLYFKGESINPSLYPGAFIKIQGNQGRDYGNYILISVTHSYSVGGQYQNFFTAIPASIVKSPLTDINALPYCESQAGVVIDNNDPEGIGRVKVKLYWQKDTQTPWLRIAMPYTGKDKGMYFVPEKGEEVMVSFEGGNAEKPYISGCLYHGKMKPDSFKNDKNDIKAIRTRSGHTIEFKDTEGEESITISDKEGTYIKFNTKEKSLQIKAIENLEIQGKNITITAEKKLELLSKENTTVGAKKNVEILADEALELQSKKDTTVKATGKVTIEATKDAALNGQNIKISGKMKADVEGMQTSLKGQMTKVQGASGKIDVM
jgi:Rhs element Vgr protein